MAVLTAECPGMQDLRLEGRLSSQTELQLLLLKMHVSTKP